MLLAPLLVNPLRADIANPLLLAARRAFKGGGICYDGVD